MPRKGTSRIWNYENLAILRRLYPTTPCQDIADKIGCTDNTVLTKAKELGLKRDPSYHSYNFIGRYTGKGPYKEPEDL